MKQAFFIMGFLVFASGCTNSPVSPFPPVLPKPSIPTNGMLLLSGFNGKYSLACLNQSASDSKGISFGIPKLDSIAVFDSIEISFHYAHFGAYPKWFGLDAWPLNSTLPFGSFNFVWGDSLTRGERSVNIRVSSSWFQDTTYVDSLTAYYSPDTYYPPGTYSDSSYFYDFVLIGLKN